MTSAAEQYRELVRHYAHEGQIPPTARQILDQQWRYLKLLSQEAAAIEQSVLQSVLQSASGQVPSEQIQPVPNPSDPDATLFIEEAVLTEPDPIAAMPDSLNSAANLEAKSEVNPEASPEAVARYQTAFAQAIRLQFPLDEVQKLGLRSLQQKLNLTEQRVESVKIGCLEAFDAEQQQYKANLEIYRDEFASSRTFLDSESVQNELWELQRQLGLRGEDILRLEREVLREAKQEAYHDVFPTLVDTVALSEIHALENKIKQELFQSEDQSEEAETDNKASRSLIPLPHVEPELRIQDILDFPIAQDQDEHQHNHRADNRVADNAQAEDLKSENQKVENQKNENQKIENLDSDRSLNPAGEASDTSNSQEAQAISSSGSPDVIVQSELDQAFQELERHLSIGQINWWEADRTTFEILLQLAPDSPNWLTMEAIEQISQMDALQRIDRLWSEASQGRFGLWAQREVYKKTVSDLTEQYQDKMKDDRLQQLYIQEFVRRLGWWDKRLQFLKFYRWLDFKTDLDANPDIPLGQFPAYWFWDIPRKHALQLGGIGLGQGGWRIDVSRLRAWINKLRSCKLEPYQE